MIHTYKTRDSDGFLTGQGILVGAVAGNAGGDVQLRGKTLFAHWLAFHTQCGLCLTMPCPMSGVETCDDLTSTEALYHHLMSTHLGAIQAKIGDVGKRKQKTAMVQDIVRPLLEPWLSQIQGTLRRRIDNLVLATFGNTIRENWSYTGWQAATWTTDHIWEVALIMPKYLKMAPKRLAKLIFDPASGETYQEQVQWYEKAFRDRREKARDARKKRTSSHAAASDSKRQKTKEDKGKKGQHDHSASATAHGQKPKDLSRIPARKSHDHCHHGDDHQQSDLGYRVLGYPRMKGSQTQGSRCQGGRYDDRYTSHHGRDNRQCSSSYDSSYQSGYQSTYYSMRPQYRQEAPHTQTRAESERQQRAAVDDHSQPTQSRLGQTSPLMTP